MAQIMKRTNLRSDILTIINPHTLRGFRIRHSMESLRRITDYVKQSLNVQLNHSNWDQNTEVLKILTSGSITHLRRNFPDFMITVQNMEMMMHHKPQDIY